MNYKNIILFCTIFCFVSSFSPSGGRFRRDTDVLTFREYLKQIQPEDMLFFPDPDATGMRIALINQDIADPKVRAFSKALFDIIDKYHLLHDTVLRDDEGKRARFTKVLSWLHKKDLIWFANFFERIKQKSAVLDPASIDFILSSGAYRVIDFMLHDPKEIFDMFSTPYPELTRSQLKARSKVGRDFEKLQKILKAVMPEDEFEGLKQFRDAWKRITVSRHDSLGDWKADFYNCIAFFDKFGNKHSPFLVSAPGAIKYIIKNHISGFSAHELSKIAGMLFEGLLKSSDYNYSQIIKDIEPHEVKSIFHSAALQSPEFISSLKDIIAKYGQKYIDTPEVMTEDQKRSRDFIKKAGLIDLCLLFPAQQREGSNDTLAEDITQQNAQPQLPVMVHLAADLEDQMAFAAGAFLPANLLDEEETAQ